MFLFALSSLQCQVVGTARAWSTHAAWPIFCSIEAKGSANCSKFDVLGNPTGKTTENLWYKPLLLLACPGVLISGFCSSLSFTWFLPCFCSYMRHFGINSYCDFIPFCRFCMSSAVLDAYARNILAEELYMYIGPA